MFRTIVVAFAVLAGLHETCRATTPDSSESPNVRLLVPAYFYPAGEGLAVWNTLLESAIRTPITAIVNPDSGPGKRVDENYRNLFRLAQKSKISLIGYVTLSYGQRPLSAVKADIDSWLHFYPDVQGVFFDEQASGAEHAPFAIECFAYARQKIDKALLVTNPGVPCAREFLAGRDAPAACLFEHEKGFDELRLPEWTASLDTGRFAVLLYGVQSTEEMKRSLSLAIQKRFGMIYLTDRTGAVPWNGLPAYWNEELELVVRINTGSGARRKN